MDDLQTIVRRLLSGGRTHDELARLVPCAASMIGMLATGARGKQTTYRIESRLREIDAQEQALANAA